jgi:hypothetical protein
LYSDFNSDLPILRFWPNADEDDGVFRAILPNGEYGPEQPLSELTPEIEQTHQIHLFHQKIIDLYRERMARQRKTLASAETKGKDKPKKQK